MSQKDKDLFFADRVYPDVHAIFSWRPKSLDEIKRDCLIVLDTNVLLAPYTSVSQKNLSVIADSYKSLIRENRVIVPAQATREFARLRPTKLSELHNQLSNLRSKDLKINLGSYPLLEDVHEYAEVRELVEGITDLAQKYKSSLGELQKVIESWEWNDPVSQIYEELFNSDVVVDPELNHQNVEKDLNWRKQNGVPPGYKDSGKVGDLLIWHTILEIGATRKKDLIFVTGDVKADWWHQSNNQNLYPRHELVEEYRRKSKGASFHMLTFPGFLSLYDVDEKVVEEVRNATPQLRELTFEFGPTAKGNSAERELTVMPHKAIVESVSYTPAGRLIFWNNDTHPSFGRSVSLRLRGSGIGLSRSIIVASHEDIRGLPIVEAQEELQLSIEAEGRSNELYERDTLFWESRSMGEGDTEGDPGGILKITLFVS